MLQGVTSTIFCEIFRKARGQVLDSDKLNGPILEEFLEEPLGLKIGAAAGMIWPTRSIRFQAARLGVSHGIAPWGTETPFTGRSASRVGPDPAGPGRRRRLVSRSG